MKNVDILEYFRIEDEGKSVILDFSQRKNGEDPVLMRDVHRTLEEIGKSSFFCDEPVIEEYLASVNAGDEVEHIVVATERDATLVLDLDKNGMWAKLTLVGQYGGKPMSGKQVASLMVRNKIAYGIKKPALQRLLEKSKEIKKGEEFTIVLAQGKDPIDGADAQFIPLVEDMKKLVLKPAINEDGIADMRDLGSYISIQPGKYLMRREPPKEGTPGRNIYGEEVPAVAGKDTPYKEYKGASICLEDPSMLISELAGIPIIQEDGVVVDDMMQMEEVSVKTGNVDIQGSLLVKGDVQTGMTIKVTGSIYVQGFVENAKLEAGLDIAVRESVFGKTVGKGESVECILKAGNNISATRIFNSHCIAGNNIEIENVADNCILDAKESIKVIDDRGKNGSIMGGRAVAERIDCKELGSTKGRDTYVEAFRSYAIKYSEIEKVTYQYKMLISEITHLKQRMSEQRDRELTKQNRAQIQDLMPQAAILKKQAQDMYTALNKEAVSRSIYVQSRIYQKVEFCFYKNKAKVDKEFGSTRVSLENGRIRLKGL